jgi:hypothetical protein
VAGTLTEPVVERSHPIAQLLYLLPLTAVQHPRNGGLLFEALSSPSRSQGQVGSQLRIDLADRTTAGQHTEPEVDQRLHWFLRMHLWRKMQPRVNR